ncbi:MAG: hypothetical protein EZS28_018114, partial [Streblomastix strix]
MGSTFGLLDQRRTYGAQFVFKQQISSPWESIVTLQSSSSTQDPFESNNIRRDVINMIDEEKREIFTKLNFKNTRIDLQDPNLELKIQMLSKQPRIEPHEAVHESSQLGKQFIGIIKDVVAVSQDIDEPLAPKTKVKLRRSRSQNSSISNNHQDEPYSPHHHHKRRKRACRSISSSISSSRSISAHTHEFKDEIQLMKFLIEATGVDKRKLKSGNVQPRQHQLHDAETRRWRRGNIWPTSKPGLHSPAVGIHALVELAKAISTIECFQINALYAYQTGESAKLYIMDAYLLTLTAGASFKVIREAANPSGWKRNHVRNHHSNNISRETQLELEHEAKLYASTKSFGSCNYRNGNFHKK